MTKAELLKNYASQLPDGPYRKQYVRYAEDFLKSNDPTKEGVNAYIKKLSKHYKPGTVNFIFRVIRRLFISNGLEWDFRRGEAPQITERDEHRPALAPELIKIMIETAKAGKMDDSLVTFLALSTIYGCRREEMRIITPKDIESKSNTIFISTVKGGRQRYHLIPPEIKPLLTQHDFSRQYSKTGVSQIFWRIVNAAGLGLLTSEDLGWHSIRRPLLSGLIDNGLNAFAAKAFLRWGGNVGELAMPERYYGNVVIGLEGTKVVSKATREDKEIFEKYHPFIEFWR